MARNMLLVAGGAIFLIVVILSIVKMSLPAADKLDPATAKYLAEISAKIDPLVVGKTNTNDIVGIIKRALPGWRVEKLPEKSGLSGDRFKSKTVVVLTNAAGKTDVDFGIIVGVNGKFTM